MCTTVCERLLIKRAYVYNETLNPFLKNLFYKKTNNTISYKNAR